MNLRHYGPRIECARNATLAGSAGILSESCSERTTKISRSPVGFCRRSCGRIFSKSTPTAAGRTIWPTKLPGATASLQLLDWWESQLDDCYRGRAARHPVFVALAINDSTNSRFRLIRFAICWSPFARIKPAIGTKRLTNLLGYCRNSANPVGRLVLYLGRCHDEQRGELVRFDLHRLATGEFLAGCGPRLRAWPDLFAAGELPARGLRRSDVCAARIQSAVSPAVGRRSRAGRSDFCGLASRWLDWCRSNCESTCGCSSTAGWRFSKPFGGSITTCGARDRSWPNGTSCGCLFARLAEEDSRP